MPKPSRSPFYFYAIEYQSRQRSRGHRMNINEAIAACYDDWKALPEEQKQIYKNQYEEWRIHYRDNPESAKVSHQHTKAKKDISTDKILQKRDIPCEELKQHYDRFGLERNFLACEYLPLDKSELLTMPIYIINFQIFCKVDEEDGGQFIPAEMCILRYTLNDGVTMYGQKFIQPELIPTGYMSSCLEQSKDTHEIPVKNFGEATNNYKLIYQELKSFLVPTITKQSSQMLDNNDDDVDDRTRRRYLRMTKPCIFFPAVEYEQTSKLFDWLQEKGEGRKSTKERRLVNFASIESLIMILAELRKHRVSRDDIQRTFENTSYSYLIEQRCPYHSHIGVSHCSVTRCHGAAKLISSFLNQLYISEKSASSIPTIGKSSPNSFINNSNSSFTNRTSENSRQNQQSAALKQTTTKLQKFHRNQYTPTNTSDSLASSYFPSNQSNDEITRIQQQNFQRLLSNADNHSDIQRNILNQRKQVLLQALQTIDQQIEELNLE
ncbi:hypothetical protein I4U23_001827 [Adineta vaga]|nr:hypothetical protein I4U23_001827 [Adineta vaga]